MGECTGKYYVKDGIVNECNRFNIVSLYEGDLVYEVIRVIERVPLFFEDHIERLIESVSLIGKAPLASSEDLHNQIRELGKKNNVSSGNVKVVFNYTAGSDFYMIYFIEAQYPIKEMYDSGVDTILYTAERKNPSAKVFNFRLRSAILDTLVRKGAYEALLVNSEGCITEGSRSNVYFIRDNSLITAGDGFVLGGITRKYINEICFRNGIGINYNCLPVTDLGKIDSVFLSGTSPHILPVRSIDTHHYPPDHPLLRSLFESYCAIVRDYVRSHR